MTPTANPLIKGNFVIAFLRQVRDELNQVTWPSRNKTLRLTVIVVTVSIAVGAYLGALDLLLTKVMGLII
jgi:preprotein translocase subunit SecE